jgi:transcriptional regulator with XRE-family HTH domain
MRDDVTHLAGSTGRGTGGVRQVTVRLLAAAALVVGCGVAGVGPAAATTDSSIGPAVGPPIVETVPPTPTADPHDTIEAPADEPADDEPSASPSASPSPDPDPDIVEPEPTAPADGTEPTPSAEPAASAEPTTAPEPTGSAEPAPTDAVTEPLDEERVDETVSEADEDASVVVEPVTPEPEPVPSPTPTAVASPEPDPTLPLEPEPVPSPVAPAATPARGSASVDMAASEPAATQPTVRAATGSSPPAPAPQPEESGGCETELTAEGTVSAAGDAAITTPRIPAMNPWAPMMFWASSSSEAAQPAQSSGPLSAIEGTAVTGAGLALMGQRVSAVSVAVDFARSSGGWAGPLVFNVWLRRQLRERRISQRHLAMLSGVNHSAISRLVNGHASPTLDTATKLVHALRIEWSDEQIATYFDMLPERTLLPTQRVESALRGDGSLSEQEVRAIMHHYLVLRARRKRAGRAAGDDGLVGDELPSVAEGP